MNEWYVKKLVLNNPRINVTAVKLSAVAMRILYSISPPPSSRQCTHLFRLPPLLRELGQFRLPQERHPPLPHAAHTWSFLGIEIDTVAVVLRLPSDKLRRFKETVHRWTSKSVLLACHHPEAVGQMDIIADAKNVKKLLKMPYSSSNVSVAIHRVGGKTLLIDDFNPSFFVTTRIHESLKRLFQDDVLPLMSEKKKDPEITHHRNMLSKLLYYSIQGRIPHPMLPPPVKGDKSVSELSNIPALNIEQEEAHCVVEGTAQLSVRGQDLSDCVSTAESEEVPSVNNDESQASLPVDQSAFHDILEEESTFPVPAPDMPAQPFHYNMEWSVKDIRMLLGSDMPLFGIGGHPAISLRLRDMKKPITVLTGMDYWLDNLMSNVPELVMCFHVDGIVKEYIKMKTEDIPSYFENCHFSTHEVLDVLYNILGFLKANCTCEGHTYWLFRKKGEDVVKLYDLTSLESSNDSKSNTSYNPFAYSVALLFYRVARSMLSSSSELSGKEVAVVKLMLQNCIKLLQQNEPEIIVSAYYMLADLYLCRVPSTLSCGLRAKCSPSLADTSDEPSFTDMQPLHSGSERKSLVASSYPMQSIHVDVLRHQHDQFSSCDLPLPPLVVDSSQDRARSALEHVFNALSIIDLSAVICWKLSGSGSHELASHKWQLASVSYLLHQAGSAYLILADTASSMEKLGRALRYAKYSVTCSHASMRLKEFTPSSNIDHSSMLQKAWQMCGDSHCLSAKLSDSLEAHIEDYELENSEDSFILSAAIRIAALTKNEEDCLKFQTDIEASLLRSIDCYEFAIKATKTDESAVSQVLILHTANSWNELGVYYMHIASSLNFASDPKQVEKFWSSSHSCLTKGLELFQKTRSTTNQALLHANLGHLMSLCARTHSQKAESEKSCGEQEFNSQERLYYKKAAEYFISGKQVLRKRATHPELWGNLVVDLSGVLLTAGVMMWKRPPLSSITQPQIERETIESMTRVLHIIEQELAVTKSTEKRYSILCERAGDCHYHLAQVYHKSAFIRTNNHSRQKQFRTQAEKHYDKALKIYSVEHNTHSVLQLQLSRSDFYSQQVQTTKGHGQLRALQNGLVCLLECKDVVQYWRDSGENQLLIDFILQLQNILKQCVTLTMKKSDKNETVSMYKAMYSITLLAFPSKLQHSDNVVPKLTSVLSELNSTFHNAT